MNFLSIAGFVFAIFVLAMGIWLSSADSEKGFTLFLDGVSIFIVIGGTFAATSISFQLNKIWTLVKIFWKKIIYGRSVNYENVIKEMMKISEAYRNESPDFDNMIKKIDDLFLKDALTILNDKIMDNNQLIDLIQTRAESMYEYYIRDANKFKTIGKFPPAFGMMGTTIGMIVLLANLSGTDAAKNIGPSMSVCLITTLYGVAIANLIIIPIGENLTLFAKEIRLKNMLIVQGVKLITEKTNPIILAEELNSYLLPSDRIDWKKLV